MNPFWTQVIIKTTLRQKRNKDGKEKSYSDYELAKGYREFLFTFKRNLKDLILITVGIFSASFGFKGFLLTNNFIDGGATGISLLIVALTKTPLYIWIICVNIPFIILAYTVIGNNSLSKQHYLLQVLLFALPPLIFPMLQMTTFLLLYSEDFF